MRSCDVDDSMLVSWDEGKGKGKIRESGRDVSVPIYRLLVRLQAVPQSKPG